MARPTLTQACALYVHRFTMEHVPAWARKACDNGKFYAPQYRTDREWYDNTTFPGETEWLPKGSDHCESNGATWPLGQWLDAPYSVERHLPPETPNDREALRLQIEADARLQAWRERGVL